MSQAALVNGYMGHALDFDDVHSDVRGHPSTVILPTLLSLSADGQVTGRRFLQAYIVGVEIMARLGQAIGNSHYLRGWHNTSTLGIIAAAGAGGFLKGFSSVQLAQTLGFAATQASGLRNQFGTETKPLHAGLAAKSALLAIQLTTSGFKGTESTFDGKLGFFSVYGEGDQDAEDILLSNWGNSWKIVTPGMWFKQYPFCSAAFHAADAAMELAPHIQNPDEIKKVCVLFPPNGDAALIQKSPSTGEQGRFSVEYVVALVLLGYPLTLDHFKDQCIPMDIQKLMSRIERQYDPTIQPAENAAPAGRFTIIEIDTVNGQSYRSRIDFPKGSPNNPVTLPELKEKLYQSVRQDSLSSQLLQVIMELEDTPDLQKLITLL